MTPEFAAATESLHPKFLALLASDHRLPGRGVKLPTAGVYLFTEDGRHLYVGRSNGIGARHGRHCKPWANSNMASFAFQLAREATGNLKAAYKAGDKGTRDNLMQDPVFTQAFLDAKARIARMEFRCVEETDQVRQALLEIYVAVSLRTPYNDFATH